MKDNVITFSHNFIRWQVTLINKGKDYYVNEILSAYTLDVMGNTVIELNAESAEEIFAANDELLTDIAYEALLTN